MACEIAYKKDFVLLNNSQFSRLIDFGLEVAETSANPKEFAMVDRMKKMRDETFWPGRGIDISLDFPEIAEQKFWCRIFFDLSRAIFERKVGLHEHLFWQAQAIHQAYAIALLFQLAVRHTDANWLANTVDNREFNKVVNGLVI